MKKFVIYIFFLLIPLNVFAYANRIIPGGDTIGIEVKTNGIMIIGFYKINGKYNYGNPELRHGDYIVKINGVDINTIEDITNIIKNSDNKESIRITFTRNRKIKDTILPLIYDEGIYKTGLYLKDKIKGIGTLTYIDPMTKIYGALGHEITESNSKEIVEIKSGFIFENKIIGIDRSYPGNAGSKRASFNENHRYGNIFRNTRYGIFGYYEDDLPNKDFIEVSNNITKGKAEIYTVIENNNINKYNIEIININIENDVKNFSFVVRDDNLIEKTGGVIQGMSGSPIIQNNHIIGVVTHVAIENPISGYGLLITKMLEEGEK